MADYFRYKRYLSNLCSVKSDEFNNINNTINAKKHLNPTTLTLSRLRVEASTNRPTTPTSWWIFGVWSVSVWEDALVRHSGFALFLSNAKFCWFFFEGSLKNKKNKSLSQHCSVSILHCWWEWGQIVFHLKLELLCKLLSAEWFYPWVFNMVMKQYL